MITMRRIVALIDKDDLDANCRFYQLKKQLSGHLPDEAISYEYFSNDGRNESEWQRVMEIYGPERLPIFIYFVGDEERIRLEGPVGLTSLFWKALKAFGFEGRVEIKKRRGRFKKCQENIAEKRDIVPTLPSLPKNRGGSLAQNTGEKKPVRRVKRK